MSGAATTHILIWSVCAAATLGVIVRPFRWPEAVWAVGGAAILALSGLVPWRAAVATVGEGLDVYLFLAGMMLLSEVARAEGLFDRVAAVALAHARGSPRRLFALVWLTGAGVTALMSNDATAVVLTPAVWAAARAARCAARPHLFACAIVANAASFILPISNPANIVLYGDRVPALGPWLAAFALPSVAAVLASFAALAFVERRALEGDCAGSLEIAPMSVGAWTALAGIVLTAGVLLSVSALGLRLGAPTFAMGAITAALVWLRGRARPLATLRGVSWQVLFLVAGLFVLVDALNRTGVVAILAGWIELGARAGVQGTAWIAGAAIAVATNLTNNLPAGLVASSALLQAHPPRAITDALLIGVDLGPNLSVTGSLATILWLTALRREGEQVDFLDFLKVGVVVTPPALALALAVRLWVAS